MQQKKYDDINKIQLNKSKKIKKNNKKCFLMWLAKSWQMVGSVGILADVLPTNPTTCQHLPNNEYLLGMHYESSFQKNVGQAFLANR